jgi:hypothetical protein
MKFGHYPLDTRIRWVLRASLRVSIFCPLEFQFFFPQELTKVKVFDGL